MSAFATPVVGPRRRAVARRPRCRAAVGAAETLAQGRAAGGPRVKTSPCGGRPAAFSTPTGTSRHGGVTPQRGGVACGWGRRGAMGGETPVRKEAADGTNKKWVERRQGVGGKRKGHRAARRRLEEAAVDGLGRPLAVARGRDAERPPPTTAAAAAARQSARLDRYRRQLTRRRPPSNRPPPRRRGRRATLRPATAADAVGSRGGLRRRRQAAALANSRVPASDG